MADAVKGKGAKFVTWTTSCTGNKEYTKAIGRHSSSWACQWPWIPTHVTNVPRVGVSIGGKAASEETIEELEGKKSCI